MLRWAPHDHAIAVRASRTMAARVLALALDEIVRRQGDDLATNACVRVDGASVTIHREGALDRELARECACAVAQLLGPNPMLSVAARGPLVVIKLVRAYDC